MSDGRSTILVVEDESDLADLLCYHLEREGYVTRRAEDGEAALAEALRHPPDLIVLDRMLPKVSGDDVATRLKRDNRTTSIPIIMLTAKAEDDDELVGFALGADDYVRKPFSLKVLLARISAVLKRKKSTTSSSETLTAGPLTLDHGRHEVLLNSKRLDLTATEFRVLSALMTARGRVLSRQQLIDAAIGYDAAVTSRAMDVHIAALRKKLDQAAGYVQTVRGVGYTFRDPDDTT